MTDNMDYRLASPVVEIRDGMPPDRESGIFLGFDGKYKPCLLQWSDRDGGFWMGLTFGPPDKTPAAFIPNEEGAQQVTRFAFLPVIPKGD